MSTTSLRAREAPGGGRRAEVAVVPPNRRAVVATVVGNWLEFFDFTVYALFAVTIGKTFFPVASASGQLLLSVATFGVGFIMRPLGGIVLGAYADRAGRKAALTVTIMLMAAGTGLLGLTPSYAQIGLAAPCAIVVARLMQGFSAGGEVGAATTYLVEAAPTGKRGLYGSWQAATWGFATLSASGLGYALTRLLGEPTMDAWGWRVPFLLGVLIGPVGLYIRRHVDETADPSAQGTTAWALLRSLFREHGRLILVGILTISGGTVSNYIIGHYMATYAIRTLHMPASVGLLAAVVAGATTIVGALAGGWLSDRFGRRVVMIVPRILFLLATYPAFLLVTTSRTSTTLLSAVALLALLQAAAAAVGCLALPECFPRAIRSSGLAITYALGVTIFGGSAQLIATWLLELTGDPMAVSYYLLAANAVSVVSLFYLRPPDAHAPLS